MGAWPSTPATKQYLDEGTDSPKNARAELASLVDKVNAIIAALAAASGVCDLDSSGEVPLLRLKMGSGNGLDADTVDGYHVGNTAGKIPLNNGEENATLRSATATKLATARTIELSGDVTSAATGFDGSINISLPTTLNKVNTAGSTYPLYRFLKPYSPNNYITNSTNYTDVAYFELGPNSGSFRFSFDIGCSNANYSSYARLYLRRAGVDTAIGTERSRKNQDFVTYTEDISNLQPGDVIVLKMKSENINNTVISSFFKISATDYPL